MNLPFSGRAAKTFKRGRLPAGMRWWLAAFVLLVSGCLQSPPAGESADAASQPIPLDPLLVGPLAVTRLDYDFGYFVVDDPTLVAFQYPVPLHGSLHLPAGDGPFPVVALMHGRHGTCDYAGQIEFLALACADAPPVVEPVNSYTGYDGLAGLLASHGYAVASLDANAINDKDLAGDAGANARAALVLRTLDELDSVNRTGQARGDLGGLPTPIPANTPSSDLAAAQGRLDLSRVGLMGHSRGGEGVARAVTLDLERNDGAHGLDAVFALAPTDFARWPVPGVAFATLLPYCDGDVSNLQGAWMYDDARRLEPVAPRHQVLAMGANHNFYNTVWTGDDWGTTGDWCGTDETGNGRDSPDQQRAHGYGLMASFFRLYVGGETAFAPLWQGAASQWPASLCPGFESCADRLYASHVPVHRLDLAPDGMPAQHERLDPERCAPADCPSQPLYSTANQATWDCHDSGFASFAVPGGLAGWQALTLRVANRPSGGNPMHVWVGVVGAQVVLPPLSGAPEAGELGFPPRPGATDVEPGAKTVLSEVRFAFPPGADLSGATGLRIQCGGDGGIQLADIMLV